MDASSPSKAVSAVRERPLLTILVALVVGIYVVRCFAQYRKLRHFRGPWFASISQLWLIRTAMSGQQHLHLWEGSKKYGKTFRIAPNALITSDEDLIRKMNAARSPYRRSLWYRAFKFDADGENVISVVDEDTHTNMRAKRAPAYSGKDNEHLEQSIEQVIFQMVRLIESKYLSATSTFRPMDLAMISQYFTLDVITSLAVSESFGHLESDSDVYGYIKTIDENFPVMNFMSFVPATAALMRNPLYQRLALPTVKDRTGMGKVKAVARDIIFRRYGNGKEPGGDMVGSFVGHGLSLQEAADESLLQLIAGSDTTATAIRSSSLHIFTNPSVLNRLLPELLPLNKQYPPSTTCIPHAVLLELPYFNACLKEAIRINPPATGILPKVTPPEGDTLSDGTFIPPGTEVGTAIWPVQRNVDVYGADSDLYRPERWLEASKDKLAHMERTLDLAFGYGRFQCLGMRVAKIELAKAMAELIRRFDITIVSINRPGGPYLHSANHGLFLQKGLTSRVERR